MITAARALAGLSWLSETWKSEAANTLVVSSLNVAAEASAVGASFTDATVRLMVAVLESSDPSLALKVKLSAPL